MITNTVLTTSSASIHTSTGTTAVVTVYFCNTSGSTRTFSLYAVPAAGSVSDGTQILKNVSVSASDTYIMNSERLVLANGESLHAVASANTSITATVNWVTI